MSLTGALTRAPLAPSLAGLDGVAAESAAARAARYGVVTAWNLEDLTDSYGSNTLTNNNAATFNTGQLGNAVYLAVASTQYLSVADNAALSAGDIDYLFATWFWVDTKTATRYLAAKRATGQCEWEFFLRSTGNGGQARFIVDDLAGASLGTVTSTAVPATGAWHLGIGYHDSVNNLVGLSLDGAAYETAATTGSPVDSTGRFCLGASDGTVSLDGRLDAAIFCKNPPGGLAALKDEIRLYLWNGGAGRSYPAGWT